MQSRGKSLLRALLPLATLLWLAFILTRSMKSGAASHAESSSTLTLLQRIAPFLTMRFVRKFAHFFEFFVLGGLLLADFRLFGCRRLVWPALLGLLATCADELIQRFVPARSGELADVLLDFSGVLAGCLAAVGAWTLVRRRRKGARDLV